MRPPSPPTANGWRALLVGLVMCVASFATVTIIVHEDDQSRSVTVQVAAQVDGPDADTKRDDTLPLNQAARDVVAEANVAPERYDLAGDLRGIDLAPAGVLDGPLASQEWPGCKTAFVNSFSSRRGVEPSGIGLHYTAGLNRAGWADLDGLTAYSNDTRNQVSWHFGVDREGNCTYNVPVGMKAWTISALNSQTINIEMVGTGKEPDYGGTAGMRTLTAIVQRIHRLYPRIPVAMGAVKDCVITRPGVITHWMGGQCSGGHIDIRPYDMAPIVQRLAAGGLTHTDKVTCRKLTWWRTHGRPFGQPERNAIRRRNALTARGVTCTSRGPALA